MSDILSVSFDVLLDQACKTADTYMQSAIEYIDKRFGDRYAEKHPQLVAAFMHVAALDFKTSTEYKEKKEAQIY
jgi:hypothetical protein